MARLGKSTLVGDDAQVARARVPMPQFFFSFPLKGEGRKVGKFTEDVKFGIEISDNDRRFNKMSLMT